MRLFSLLAATIALTGCSKKTACYGLTDNEVLQSIQGAYAGSRDTPEMARKSRLDKSRVIAVERFGARGEDAFSGMIFVKTTAVSSAFANSRTAHTRRARTAELRTSKTGLTHSRGRAFEKSRGGLRHVRFPPKADISVAEGRMTSCSRIRRSPADRGYTTRTLRYPCR